MNSSVQTAALFHTKNNQSLKFSMKKIAFFQVFTRVETKAPDSIIVIKVMKTEKMKMFFQIFFNENIFNGCSSSFAKDFCFKKRF